MMVLGTRYPNLPTDRKMTDAEVYLLFGLTESERNEQICGIKLNPNDHTYMGVIDRDKYRVKDLLSY